MTTPVTGPEFPDLDIDIEVFDDNTQYDSSARVQPSRSRKTTTRSEADEVFLASRRGDTRKLTNLLTENPTLNVDIKEPDTGHSALRLAVKNNHIDVVEQLIGRSHPANIYEALMLSISLGYDHITELFLKSATYPVVSQYIKDTIQGGIQEKLSKTTETETEEEEEDFVPDDSLCSSDITPIILAAQKNQFDIVKILIDLGDRITEPHDYYCQCEVCRGASSFDELRFAKTRLNTYKGLASESYISLCSRDPILAAFELRAKLKQLGVIEKYFRTDYAKLEGHLSEYVMRLLDKVRDGQELDIILNEGTGASFVAYDKLARLKLALFYHEKKFVAHPSCQKRLTSIWFGNIRPLERADWWLMLPTLVLLLASYPILALLFWIYPLGKVGRFLKTPVVKFYSSALSYATFIAILIAHTSLEQASEKIQLSEHPTLGNQFEKYLNECISNGQTPKTGDIFVRYHDHDVITIVLCIWIGGLIWLCCKKMYTERMKAFVESWYNISDVIMLILYIISFILKFFVKAQVQSSVKFFESYESWQLLSEGNEHPDQMLYWLSADRYHWDLWDPGVVSDALFAIANVMSVTRMTYILAVSERLGPLIISLARMIMDVFAFMIIFLLVIIAFVLGFHNLYWYYNENVRSIAETNTAIGSGEGTPAEGAFGDYARIIRTVFWSIFGMADYDSVELGDYGSSITSVVGEILFGIYNWIIIIILINMLIAMMARSYETIAAEEDMEWKFSRSKLYMEYIREGDTLCVPFNLVPSWKSVYDVMRKCCHDCSQKKVEKGSEINGIQKQVKNGGSSSNRASATSPPTEYEVIIGRIVKRYVAHGVAQNEDDEDQLQKVEQQMGDLKKDVSNFRYEMITSLRKQEESHTTTHRKVSDVKLAVETAEDNLEGTIETEISKSHQKMDVIHADFAELKVDMLDFLEKSKENSADVSKEVNAIFEKMTELDHQIVDIAKSLDQMQLGPRDAPRVQQMPSGRKGLVTQYGTTWKRSSPAQSEPEATSSASTTTQQSSAEFTETSTSVTRSRSSQPSGAEEARTSVPN